MENKQNYYVVIPGYILKDKTISDFTKLLYGQISSLTNDLGYCYALNQYFVDHFGKSKRTIEYGISALVSKGHITSQVIYKPGTKQIVERHLRLSVDPRFKFPVADNTPTSENKGTPTSENCGSPHAKNCGSPHAENCGGNNKEENSKEKDILQISKKKYYKPSLLEIEALFKKRNYKSSAESFHQHWNDNDWVDKSGKKVKDWKRRASTWESNNTQWNAKGNAKEILTLSEMETAMIGDMVVVNGSPLRGLAKELAEFFKCFENYDKELMQIYFRDLSKGPKEAIVVQLRRIRMERPNYKNFPSTAEILAPLVNQEKEDAWAMAIKAHRESISYGNEVPANIFPLVLFLALPRNMNDYDLEKAKKSFMNGKYVQWKMICNGEMKSKHYETRLLDHGISIDNLKLGSGMKELASANV